MTKDDDVSAETRHTTEAGLKRHQPVLAWHFGRSGKSLNDLARAAGIGVLTIQNAAKGNNPRRATLSKLAQALEVEERELLPETDGREYIERLAIHAETSGAARRTLLRVLADTRAEDHPWHGAIGDEQAEALREQFRTSQAMEATRRAIDALPSATPGDLIVVHTSGGDRIEVPAEAMEALTRKVLQEFNLAHQTVLVDTLIQTLDARMPAIVRDVIQKVTGPAGGSGGPSPSPSHPATAPSQDVEPSATHEEQITTELAAKFQSKTTAEAIDEPGTWYSERAAALVSSLRDLEYDPEQMGMWAEDRLAVFVSDFTEASAEDIETLRGAWETAWRKALTQPTAANGEFPW